MHNIVNHSEAKLLFVGDMVWENLNESAMPLLEGILMMNDFTLLVSRSERLTHAREHLNEMFGKKYPKNFRKEHIEYHKDEPEELAVINYTSGTTSYSKGDFAVHGEEYFRNCESNTLISLQEKRHVVVSCGGGVPLREKNVALMKKSGYVVWLTATPEAIFERVKDSTERPLLNGNMRVDFIRDLMESRREKYEAAADICIDTTEKDIVEICEELLQKLSSLQNIN